MILGCALIASGKPLIDIDVSTFSSSAGDGVTSFDAGAKTVSVAYGTTTTRLSGTVPVTVGKRYRITWAFSGDSGMQTYFGSTAGGVQYRAAIAGDVFWDVTAPATPIHMSFQRIAVGTTVASNLKVQEIPEVSWVDTAEITPANWVNLSAGVTVDGTTGAITIPAAGSSLSARQELTTVAGTLYRIRWVNNSNTTMCLIGTSQGGGQFKTSSSSDAVGSRTFEFRASSTTSWLQYQRTAAGTAVVSDIFMQVLA